MGLDQPLLAAGSYVKAACNQLALFLLDGHAPGEARN